MSNIPRNAKKLAKSPSHTDTYVSVPSLQDRLKLEVGSFPVEKRVEKFFEDSVNDHKIRKEKVTWWNEQVTNHAEKVLEPAGE